MCQAWCLYEAATYASSGPICSAATGGLCTYALNTLVSICSSAFGPDLFLLFSFIWECFIPSSVGYSCCIHETWHGQVAFIFNVYHINHPLIALVVFFRHYVTFDWERLVMHNRGVTG